MNTIAALALTTPVMLWGMAAVALPIVAHLLNRRVRRRVVFPTVRFLLEAAASQSRVFRLRRWILLSLRCAAMVLLAWAFARPMWHAAGATPGPGGGGGGGGRSVILVLDVSASTAQRIDGVSVVTRIAAQAARILEALESGRDRADIVYAQASPRAAYPRPIRNLDALKQEVRVLAPTSERADIAAAIALGQSLLDNRGGEIFVISDMQRTNWAQLIGRGPALSANTRLTVLPDGTGAASNTGLLRPAISPARPLVRRPSRLTALVANFSDHARRGTVRAEVDGVAAGSRTLPLGPGQQEPVSFELMFTQPGPHRVTLASSDDDLDLDNTIYLAAEAASRLRIAVIADDDLSQPLGAGYFVTRVLAPVGDDSDAYEIARVPVEQVSQTSLSGAQAVIVTDVGALTEPAATALAQYVAGGGGLLVFSGAGPVTSNAGLLQKAAGGQPLLPFTPLQVKPRIRGAAWYLKDGTWTSPALRAFDEASRLALGEVPFYRVRAAGQVSPAATVLLRFDDGTPALAVVPYGQGSVALANFSPASDSSELAKHGSFVALMHGMLDELRPARDGSKPAVVGQRLTISHIVAAGPALRVAGPEGRGLPSSQVTDSAGSVTVQTAATGIPGLYSVLSGDQVLTLRGVNIDERESDLRRINVDELGLGSPPVEIPDAASPAPTDNSAQPLWWWFVIAAATALGLEMVLLNLWRR